MVAVGVVARHGRLVVEQVDVAARGAGYHDGIHGVMAVVNPFLVESLLQFKRHVRYLVSTGACRCELACACKLVEAAEARQHYAVPHILHAPVFLQPVGYRAVSGYDVLRYVLLLAVLAHDVRHERLHQFADVAAVVQLPCNEVVRDVVHEQFAHFRTVILIDVGNEPLVFLDA